MNANVQRQKFRRELDLRRYLEGDGVIGAYLPFIFPFPFPFAPFRWPLFGSGLRIGSIIVQVKGEQANNEQAKVTKQDQCRQK